VPGPELLKNAKSIRINPAFSLEVLPNRDSLPYADKYGIPEVRSMFRGTLRYEGFSSLMSAFASLGLLYGADCPDLAPGASSRSCKAFFASLVPGGSADMTNAQLLSLAAAHVGLGADITAGEGKRFGDAAEWIGLLSPSPLPLKGSRLDVFVALLVAKPEMSYAAGERDMCLMHHEVRVVFPATGVTQLHTATLIQYTEDGVTSMSKTVGLTAAIGTQLILDGAVEKTGMVTPVTPEWYEPMLHVLHKEGVKFHETVRDL